MIEKYAILYFLDGCSRFIVPVLVQPDYSPFPFKSFLFHSTGAYHWLDYTLVHCMWSCNELSTCWVHYNQMKNGCIFCRYFLIHFTYTRSPTTMPKDDLEEMATDGIAHMGQRPIVHPAGTRRGWKRVVTRAEWYEMYGGHCRMDDRGQVGTRVGSLKPSHYVPDLGQLYWHLYQYSLIADQERDQEETRYESERSNGYVANPVIQYRPSNTCIHS
jgi:hypothetical protein